MSYGNQYMHDRNLPRFGYTDAAPLAEGHVLSETKPDGSLRYSLSEEYMDQQLAHRKKLGKWEPGEPTRGSSSARCNPSSIRCR